MNTRARFVLSVLGLAFLSVASAHAKGGGGVEINVYGGVGKLENSPAPTATPGVTGPTASYAVLGGVGIGIPIIPLIQLELGATYAMAKQSMVFAAPYAATGTLDLSYTSLIVPLLARFNFGPLGVGAGGYYGAILGKAKIETTGTIATVLPSGEYDMGSTVVNSSTSDYGAVGDVRLGTGLGPVRLFVGGRYLFGLKNKSAGTEESKTRAMMAYAGVGFGF